jgi:hypothetical protein
MRCARPPGTASCAQPSAPPGTPSSSRPRACSPRSASWRRAWNNQGASRGGRALCRPGQDSTAPAACSPSSAWAASWLRCPGCAWRCATLPPPPLDSGAVPLGSALFMRRSCAGGGGAAASCWLLRRHRQPAASQGRKGPRSALTLTCRARLSSSWEKLRMTGMVRRVSISKRCGTGGAPYAGLPSVPWLGGPADGRPTGRPRFSAHARASCLHFLINCGRCQSNSAGSAS